MWRVYRAIEGINELHDIVGVWMAEGLLIKHEIFTHTLLNGEHKYDI